MRLGGRGHAFIIPQHDRQRMGPVPPVPAAGGV